MKKQVGPPYIRPSLAVVELAEVRVLRAACKTPVRSALNFLKTPRPISENQQFMCQWVRNAPLGNLIR